MPAETEYRDETRTPTREELDAMAGPVLLEFGAPGAASAARSRRAWRRCSISTLR